MDRPLYPFTAVVGQERAKQALLCLAVEPRIGGGLLCGEKGTAKSTLVRALGGLEGVRLLELPERPCLQLQEDVILEREIDFALKKLAHRHEEVIRALGTQCMGAVLDESQRARGIYNHFCSVFYLGCRRREADGALPAGAYASVFYRGPYSQLADVCAALWPRLAAQGLRQDGPVMELYHIDAHDTARVDEYLTEVQVRVARAGQKGSGEHGV